ncbi:hypothetical protein Baya_11121 [Bagarius yarrelli]|uniref:Uncharacterized protein n=1 Tax=Bagarius yarrelli TaxID=175774 RepID=A0A556UZ31_BAGYA|nr:hypothetical protein Baya_11121 [Bagarius yarrelli]
MISLFPTSRTRPELCPLSGTCPRARAPSPPGRFVFSYRYTLPSVTREPSELHFLFGPTRKSARQATPPPRHRQQQRHAQNLRDGKPSRMRTKAENQRSAHGIYRTVNGDIRSESELRRKWTKANED